ncbi:hypothetical protein NPIL_292861, partial [Nephila pilipes]
MICRESPCLFCLDWSAASVYGAVRRGQRARLCRFTACHARCTVRAAAA